MSNGFDIHIIGGGLAGSEAAWQLAEAGLKVRLSEMRGGGDTTPAHETDRLAEMVCSNSFRSDDAENNAVGLLHQEMRALGSLVMRAADKHRVPAGSALAVDREAFAAEVTRQIGKTVLHSNLSPAEYREALVRAGIPGGVAEMLVDFDRAAARGDLDDSSDVLRRLIGRPPTSLHDAVAIALKAAA